MSDVFLIQSGREIASVEDWFQYAPPKRGERQWQRKRSAMESARAWLRSGKPRVPSEITEALDSQRATTDFQPLYAIPELVTRLDEFRGEHRNHDLVVLGMAQGRRTLIGVEAKADEAFGSMTVAKYLTGAAKKSGSNAPERVRRLLRALFGAASLSDEANAVEPYASLRYQLLTALAGTLIEARRRWAEQAVLMVHEFTSSAEQGYPGSQPANLERNTLALESFVEALPGGSAELRPGQLVGPLHAPGSDVVPSDVPFFIGKATVHLGGESSRVRG